MCSRSVDFRIVRTSVAISKRVGFAVMLKLLLRWRANNCAGKKRIYGKVLAADW
jgi:hypothetical protein